MNIQRLAVVFPILAALFASHPAHAAESYDNCTGFIESLPTTVSTQGVWCLRHDLATAMSSGNAITIAGNNITVDCNGFKIGGLAAGSASLAEGINSNNRQNATVRHCNIRGFRYGIDLFGGGGHLVEDNRLDNNLEIGIVVQGDNNRVRRNAVYDTGGRIGSNTAYGIDASADIVDNTVSGLIVEQPNGLVIGIAATGPATRVSANVVSGLGTTATSGGSAYAVDGIYGFSTPISFQGNSVFGPGTIGIFAANANSLCLGNTVSGFSTGFYSCTASGNLMP
jgi:parallel beta-helix repeat protein